MTAFVLRATVMCVGGDSERIESIHPFLLLWLHHVLWTLSLLCFPAWPGLAWQASCLIYYLHVTEGVMMESL
jgi:hypothetical protein